jgi:integrase
VIGAVAHGHDPVTERLDARTAMTVSELVSAFLTEHVRAKRKIATFAHYQHALKAHVEPEFGLSKAEKLTRAEIAGLHLRLGNTPAAANHVISVIRCMYNFAQRRGYVPEGSNPATRIEKYPEHGRERFLTVEELGRIGDAMREAEIEGIPWGIDESNPKAKHAPSAERRRTIFDSFAVAALRLLLLTGCRLREILHLRWDCIDFEREMIFFNDSKTGRKLVVLNAPALLVLSNLPRLGPYVIPGMNPELPRHDLKKLWKAVSQRAGLLGVRIHDLRHTFASFGAGAGLGLPIIGKLLGHSQATTTQRYAHLDADPVRRASDTISKTIEAALDRKSGVEAISVRSGHA